MKVLSKSGHTVATADSGREAIDQVEREQFDIILMDVQMPGMSGLDAIREIRTHEIYSGTRVAIIAVTAHVLSGDADQCYDAGADAYLPKPINLADLMSVLKTVAEALAREGETSPELTEFRSYAVAVAELARVQTVVTSLNFGEFSDAITISMECDSVRSGREDRQCDNKNLNSQNQRK